MKICIFEDRNYDQLYPLTYLRAVFELRCGYTELIDKIKEKFKKEAFSYFVREHLAPSLKTRLQDEPVNDLNVLHDDLLLINGRWLARKEDVLQKDGPEEVGISGDDMVYLRVRKETIERYFKGDFHSLLDDLKANIKHKDIIFIPV